MTVPDEGALLKQLSAQIERDVLAVHHTCAETITKQLIALFFLYRKIVHEANKTLGGTPTSEEAQPLGQDVGGFGLDQDLPAVQRHAGAHLPAHVEHGRLLLDARGRVQLKCSAAHELTHTGKQPLTASGT